MTKTKTKTIETLVEDIDNLLKDGVTKDEAEKALKVFEDGFGEAIRRQLYPSPQKNGLRMSNIGSPCARKLWYNVHEYNHEDKETLRGDTKLKFIYGDLTEELILLLAVIAGHKVEGQQDEFEILGIKGHRDCVIDGMLVDVKSASSYSFKKFRDGKLLEDDPFGYHIQLMSYLYSSQDDPLVTEKDRAGFLVFDKQLGHICLDIHEKPSWFDEIPEAYQRRIDMVAGDIPDRDFEPVPDGKSGNMKLDTFCSYCDFKKVCHPGLRTFLYSRGPVYLTEVQREPKATEILEDGTLKEYKKEEQDA